LELIDLEEKKIRYLEVNKISNSNREHEYGYLNEINESEFLFELSPTKQGNFYTLDFNGNLNEWETNKMKLDKSLDEWQEMIMDRESAKLKIEVFKESPNTQLKEFKGPKHGKVDANNDPHVGNAIFYFYVTSFLIYHFSLYYIYYILKRWQSMGWWYLLLIFFYFFSFIILIKLILRFWRL